MLIFNAKIMETSCHSLFKNKHCLVIEMTLGRSILEFKQVNISLSISYDAET